MQYAIIKQMLFATLLVLLVGCDVPPAPDLKISQEVIGGEVIFEMASPKVRDKINRFAKLEGEKIYGLKVYKIPYTTKDSNNNIIKVSGLLSVPVGVKHDIGMVSYNHGTITLNKKAPTVRSQSSMELSLASYMFGAIGGFAILEADYVGYGDSHTHYHPYMLKNELADTSIDFIMAVRKFAKNNNIKLNDQLYIAGYSEGGYVSMATLQKLESLHIRVAAAAPMAGAYDLNYMARAVLGQEEESLNDYAMTYTLLTLNAYAKKYNHDIKTIIKEPYASKIDTLLDGKHSFMQIDSVLPIKEAGRDGLLKEEFLHDYQSSKNHWLYRAFEENSVHDWHSKTDIKLIHCWGDDQVPYTISQRTAQAMRQRGSRHVDLITPDALKDNDEKLGHLGCFIYSMEYAAKWFADVSENFNRNHK